ncbi:MULTISPECIES: extracellular catalytic domain type 1 short-chain-length polyhydroxyalkanoate depolymerase [unclassified Marinovum]
MTKFNAGPQRPAAEDARAKRLAAANDLVQRTLAQNGLLPGSGPLPSGAMQPGLPSLDALLAGLGVPGSGLSGPAAPTAPLPDGAAFRSDRFTCAAGSRNYRTYVPASATEGVTGIVVMLHGCTQTPEDFAVGTGMNALAEQHRFVVLYPEQSRGDNAQSCWNWFSRGDQQRDRGEPAILAEMAREAMRAFDVPADRTFVAGLSAGAAMAVILGETYPDVFAAIGAHSGLPFGAARDMPSAFAAMSGTAQDTARRSAEGNATRSIVFHGSADATVHPSNGGRIARDVLDRSPGQTIQTERQEVSSGRQVTVTTTTGPDGAPELEHWVIDGLGHAWSGGQAGGSYTDPKGPNASAEMIRFFFDAPIVGA